MKRTGKSRLTGFLPSVGKTTRSIGYSLIALAAGVTAPSIATAQQAAAPAVQVYTNFTLIDGTDRAAQPDSAMAVSNGHIVWIGPVSKLPNWSNGTTIDLSGKYVIPGLIDGHVHIGNTHGLAQDQKYYTRASVEKDLAQYASYGITSVAVMGTDKDFIFDIRKEQRQTPPTTARVFTTGQGIVFKGGYGGVVGINHPVSTPAEARAEVNAQADKGADYIKLWIDDELGSMPKMPPEISRAAIEEAHRRGLRAFAHIFYLADAKRLVGQGVDGFVHSVRDQPIDAELITMMKRHHSFQESATLSREQSLVDFGTEAPQFDDAFFAQAMSPETLTELKSAKRRTAVSHAEHYPLLPQFAATAKANMKRQIDAGIPVGMGTDSGPPGRFAGYFAHWELQLMVEAGMTPAQALRSATGDVAEMIGATDVGTLQQSKWADFVVLDADPLRDITNTRRINAVYIAGKQVRSATSS